MEDLIGVLFAALIFAISTASKSKKRQKKSAAARAYEPIRAEQFEKPIEPELKAVAPKAVPKTVNQKPEPVKRMTSEFEHMHEGKAEAPCPAEEVRPAQRVAEQPAATGIPGLNLKFDRNAVLQGFVMNEILNRPRPGMRR